MSIVTSINRRKFLGATGIGIGGAIGLNAVGAMASGQIGGGFWSPATASADTVAGTITGTTLEQVAVPLGDTGYRKLTAGAGWPIIIRTELAPAKPGRADTRRNLCSIVQMTDMHILDAQSPVRAEFVHPLNSSASRPQDTLTTQGLVSLVNRINRLRRGPITGRAFDAVVTTGDNTDNHEHIELEWLLTTMNGGALTPNTGDPNRYEGTQNSGLGLYWNPEKRTPGTFDDAGFPIIKGFLTAALAPISSPGLDIPWYSVFGNHDDAVLGVAPSGIPPITALYTGNIKLGIPSNQSDVDALAAALRNNPAAVPGLLQSFTDFGWIVTPDDRRMPFTPREFMAAHLAAGATGPGPHGHGFTAESVETGAGYYSFDISPGVVGISMDSTNRAGFIDGSLGSAQLKWIEDTLAAGSSRYYGADGRLVNQQRDDTLFVLFSHHTSDTMDTLVPDPENPLEPRHSGMELIALLNRFPNVCAWVNGHTHDNRIFPHAGPTPEQGFWEINTASHIDFPQQARIIEITDNRDGTLSLLATLIEADAPYATDYSDLSQHGLASLYRELAFNDVHTKPDREGTPQDQNVELLLASPLR